MQSAQVPFSSSRKGIKMTGEAKPVRPAPGAYEKIIVHLHRIRRPEYVGTLAVEIGYGLPRTESYVQYMIDSGELEMLSEREKLALGVSKDAIMVRLVEKFSMAKAHRT